MNIDEFRNICNKLPAVTEDIKWGNDLCFMVGEKMFCVLVLNGPLKISIKVTPEEFGELSISPGIVPAPYAARHKWILVENLSVFNKARWEYYIRQSYSLVKGTLTKKKQAEINSQKPRS